MPPTLMTRNRFFRTLALAAVALWSAATIAGPPTYPFGARTDAYPYGIKPSLTNAQMDDTIRKRYDGLRADGTPFPGVTAANTWKGARLVDVPTIPGGKAVKFSDNPAATALTVSEGMGYGMLITVIMAGHDPNAQAIFDGLLTTVRARPAYSATEYSTNCDWPAGSPLCSPNAKQYLMDWKLAADGSPGGGASALDGDLDIAMALLMADRQWGSNGTKNYKQEAINTINAMKGWGMKPDGTTKGCMTKDASRTSDYMIGHFRAFAVATGDPFWNTKAIDRAYELIDYMQTKWSPATNVGLMPDVIVKTDSTAPEPSAGHRCDQPSTTENTYFENAKRNPWRWGTDYLHSGDQRWKTVLTRMMTFFLADNKAVDTNNPQQATPGNPPGETWIPLGNMAIGYRLNGVRMNSEVQQPWPARGVVGGAMIAAQVDPAYQSYLNDSWNWLDAKWIPAYYEAELILLPMIVASGNWWNPTSGNAPQAIRIQAESASWSGSGVAVRNEITPFEGSGYVGGFTTNGDALTVTFPGLAAGTYSVNIRYQAWTVQQNDVVVNGTASSQAFPTTGNAWSVKSISGVSLPSGTNRIAIRKDWGNINVDYVEVIPGNTTGAIRLQAETAGVLVGTGVTARSDELLLYDGAGYVGHFTGSGDKVTVNFPNVAAGIYNVRIRYHAWTTQQNNVLINGTASSQLFPQTGDAWVVKTISGISLPSGPASVAVSKDWGNMDVDWIEIGP